MYAGIERKTTNFNSMDNCFFDTITHLRAHEEILLYVGVGEIPDAEIGAVADYLERDYERECLDYPGDPPEFDQAAALWSARVVYHAAQLLLNRHHVKQDLGYLLAPFEGDMTEGAILSADICLRFLPDVVAKARKIDPDDDLILLLEILMGYWPYSNLGLKQIPKEDDLGLISGSACLRQLYADRVIALRVLEATENPMVKAWVITSLGEHQNYFWKELTFPI